MDPSALFDSDDDADLRRAIALSLEDVRQSNRENPVELSSDEDEDEDDDDLEKPLVHRRDLQATKQFNVATVIAPPPSQQQQAPPGLAAFGLAGIDRKKMEEERIARLGKRKAPDSEQEIQGRQSKLRSGPAPVVSRPIVTANAIASSQGTSSSSNHAGLRFPKGAVKKTWARGYPRTGDDIKIEEILHKNELELAVLSSYQWDDTWMMSKIDFTKTKVVCIAYASSQEHQEEIKENAPRGAVRFCFPPMLPMGSMHSKLQLLRFPNYLRVVVPSGNLVSYDWGETGAMENTVFIIDLPRIEDPAGLAANKLTMFGEELSFFLRAQGLGGSLIDSLKKYDFTETRRYAFVHSIGQSNVDDSWKRTGYCGLGRAVSALNLEASDDIEVDFVAPSLGSVNNDLINAIYYAAQGDDGLKEYRQRTAKGRTNRAGTSEDTMATKLKDRFRIYFPSHDTVAQSRGGKGSAGTICAQSKWWDSDKFPRHLVRDCKNVRPGLLIHSKIMLVRPCQETERSAAWAYVGSANLSESAWGRLTKDKQTGNPKLTCRNWECGVIVPVTSTGSDQSVTSSRDTKNDLAVFVDTIPVPFVSPGEAYGKTGSKRPWLFQEK